MKAEEGRGRQQQRKEEMKKGQQGHKHKGFCWVIRLEGRGRGGIRGGQGKDVLWERQQDHGN